MANAPFKMPGFSGFGNESSPGKQVGSAVAGAMENMNANTTADTTGVPPHSHESGGVVPTGGMDAAQEQPQEEKTVTKAPSFIKRMLGGGLFGRMF
jgi:hypothetical protein